MSHRPRRRPIRRRLTAAALALAALVTASACAGPRIVGSTIPRAEATQSVDWSTVRPASQITWWSNHPGQSQAVEKELIARFHKIHPEITVKLVTAGSSYDEVAQRFQAAATTTDVPDLVEASDVWWFRYHLNDQIMPLDGVLNYLHADTADFVPSLYGDYAYDGQHWAVPYARSMPLFYYNKDVWAAAGLPDRGPTTWSELERWSKSIAGHVPPGGSAFGLNTGPSWGAWWYENMLWGQGGAYSDGFHLTLNTPQARAAGTMLSGLFTSGTASLSKDSMNDFTSGVVASTIGTTGSLTSALDSASFPVGTAYLPDGPRGGGTPTGGTGLAIPSSISPQRQLAAAMFLAFITDTQNTAYFAQHTGYMPVRTSAIDSPTMQGVYRTTPQFKTAVDQLRDKAHRQDDYRVFVPGADALLNSAIERIIVDHADPATAFTAITGQLETAYRENVEPYL